MPQVIETSKNHVMPRLFAAAAIVVAVLIVVGVVWWSQQHKRLTLAQMRQKATTLAAQGQYDAGAKVAEDYFNSEPNKNNKIEAATVLGTIYLNKRDYPKVKLWFGKKVVLSGKTDLTSAQGLAEAARGTGDVAGEITYTKQVIELFGKNSANPVTQGESRAYQDRIVELEKTKP